jgi:hypothetical protein
MKVRGLLLDRHVGGDERRHDGRIAVDERNRRWCSDGFEIGCDNGERVRVAFALDCCDREAMSFLPGWAQFARGCLDPHLFKNAEGAEGQGRAAGAVTLSAQLAYQAYDEGFDPSLPAIQDTDIFNILSNTPRRLGRLGGGLFDIFVSSIDFMKRKR